METKVKPEDIKHHVNSFLRTDGDKLRIDNGFLVLLRHDGDKEKWRVFLPVGVAERVLKVLHNEKGHFRFAKTREAVKSRYFWFNWQRDVRDWCNLCDTVRRVYGENVQLFLIVSRLDNSRSLHDHSSGGTWTLQDHSLRPLGAINTFLRSPKGSELRHLLYETNQHRQQQK